MEAIVVNEGSSNEDIISFSNLKEMKLSKVPRLRSFYKEKNDNMMPSIQFQPLFHTTVEFPSLEGVVIDNLEDASCIWGMNNDADNSGSSFCKLKSVTVHKCNNLESVIPAALLQKLQSMEFLRVSDCSSVISEIGTHDNHADICPLPALSQLYLEDLPSLEETWLNSRNYSTSMTMCPNLKKLRISNCNNLKNVFIHFSIARDVLHLEDIKVKECKMMREIIGKGKQSEIIDVFLFPKLRKLCLEHLPTLTSFYGGEEANTCNKVEFTNLVDFKLISCGELNLEEIELGRDDSTCQLESLEISCDNGTQLPCKWQPRLYNLETLILSRCWWNELVSVLFRRLKVLRVESYGCSSLFTFSGFRSLQQLEVLQISDCAFLEEIAEDDEISGTSKKTITLFRLRTLVLKDLPKLKSFIHDANHECRVPSVSTVELENCGLSNVFPFSVFTSLRTLKISRCALLEEIVEDIRSDEVSGIDKKSITLPHLESVTLEDLPKLKSFIYDASHECLLPNLRKVSVSNCGLSSLFMCSDFESLQQLTQIEISDCAFLEEIVEDIRSDEISGMNKKTLTLSRLISVTLKDLPQLKSFLYDENHECLMPNLRKVSVNNCGLSSLFTFSGFTSLQQLEDIEISDCRSFEGIFEYARGDETPGTVEQIISLSKLMALVLKNLPELKSFIHRANYDCYMPALQQMEVDNCGFSTLVTCSVFRDLQNFRKLQVSNCRFLEFIVEDARGDETSDTNDITITLPLLRNIGLDHLPNLKSFSRNQSYAFNMPTLWRFILVGCPMAEDFTCLNTSTTTGFVTDDNGLKKVSDLNAYMKRVNR